MQTLKEHAEMSTKIIQCYDIESQKTTIHICKMEDGYKVDIRNTDYQPLERLRLKERVIIGEDYESTYIWKHIPDEVIYTVGKEILNTDDEIDYAIMNYIVNNVKNDNTHVFPRNSLSEYLSDDLKPVFGIAFKETMDLIDLEGNQEEYYHELEGYALIFLYDNYDYTVKRLRNLIKECASYKTEQEFGACMIFDFERVLDNTLFGAEYTSNANTEAILVCRYMKNYPDRFKKLLGKENYMKLAKDICHWS